MEVFGEGEFMHMDEKIYVSFARFETRVKEYDRARTIYKYALNLNRNPFTRHILRSRNNLGINMVLKMFSLEKGEFHMKSLRIPKIMFVRWQVIEYDKLVSFIAIARSRSLEINVSV